MGAKFILPKDLGKVLWMLAALLISISGKVYAGDAQTAERDAGPHFFWELDLEEVEALKELRYGLASWYGGRFHGRRTANGERYDKFALTCASRTLPFGTILEITNLKNGKSVLVRVNDRGPYWKNRVLDVSYAVAKKLGFVHSGLTKVAYRVVHRPR